MLRYNAYVLRYGVDPVTLTCNEYGMCYLYDEDMTWPSLRQKT